MNKTDTRERLKNFAFMLYEDSMKKDAIEILGKMGCPGYIVKHDRDIDEKTGERKKTHYHVMIMLKNQKEVGKIEKEIIEPVKGVGLEKIQDAVSYGRYMKHDTEDSKSKYQYADEDIIAIGDVIPYGDFIKQKSRKDIRLIKIDIENYLQKGHFSNSYYKLWRYAVKYKPEWVEELEEKSGFYVQLLKSKAWTEENDPDPDRIADENGTIIEL